MVTPLHISIALHYGLRNGNPFRDLHLAKVREAADALADAGLLVRTAPVRDGIPTYAATEGLNVWVQALCATPFPVQQWIMPDAAAA